MLEDIDARKRTEAELIHRSNHDALTSLPTRAYFLDRLRDARGRAALADAGVGVVFIDLDSFKQVNDTAGHHAGDELLIAIAARLRSALRPADSSHASAATSSSCSRTASPTRATPPSSRGGSPSALPVAVHGRRQRARRLRELRRLLFARPRRGRRGSRPQGGRGDVHGEAARAQPRRGVRRARRRRSPAPSGS